MSIYIIANQDIFNILVKSDISINFVLEFQKYYRGNVTPLSTTSIIFSTFKSLLSILFIVYYTINVKILSSF